MNIRNTAAAAAKSPQSCPTQCDPTDCSLPGSSAHGIFQARVLEWGAIAFSVSNTNLHQILQKAYNFKSVCADPHDTVFISEKVNYEFRKRYGRVRQTRMNHPRKMSLLPSPTKIISITIFEHKQMHTPHHHLHHYGHDHLTTITTTTILNKLLEL